MWHALQVYRSCFTLPSSQWTPGECSAPAACASVINNCCSGPASGQTDLAVFHCAACCFLLRNYLCFNSPLCNKGVGKSHKARERDRIKMSFSLAAQALTFTTGTKKNKKTAPFSFYSHNHLLFFPPASYSTGNL